MYIQLLSTKNNYHFFKCNCITVYIFSAISEKRCMGGGVGLEGITTLTILNRNLSCVILSKVIANSSPIHYQYKVSSIPTQI